MGRDYRSRRAARRCGRSPVARPRLRDGGARRCRSGADRGGGAARGVLRAPPGPTAAVRRAEPSRGEPSGPGAAALVGAGRRVPPRCGCPCAAAVARPPPPPPPKRRRSHGAEGGGAGAAAAGPRLHRGERGEGERAAPSSSLCPPPPAHPRRWRGGGTRLRDADAAAGVRGLRLGVGVGGHLLGGVGPEEGGGAASPLSRRPCPQRGRRGPACAPGGGPVRGAGGGAGGSCAPGQPGEGK